MATASPIPAPTAAPAAPGQLDEWQCGNCGAINPSGSRTWCMRCRANVKGGVDAHFATRGGPPEVKAITQAQVQGFAEIGTVARWFDEKGFGFIHPKGRDDTEVFIHRSALPGGDGSMSAGLDVFFDMQEDSSGKLRCTRAAGPACAERGQAQSGFRRGSDALVPHVGGTGSEKGTVSKWYDEKGYGFIEHHNCFGKEEIFVHRSAANEGSLCVGMEVNFDITMDNQGKLRACNCGGPGVFPRGEAPVKQDDAEEGPSPEPRSRNEPKHRSNEALEWDRRLHEGLAARRKIAAEAFNQEPPPPLIEETPAREQPPEPTPQEQPQQPPEDRAPEPENGGPAAGNEGGGDEGGERKRRRRREREGSEQAQSSPQKRRRRRRRDEPEDD